MTDLERRVPRREHRQVVVVELLDGLRVVDLELVVGDLVDPRAHDLAQELAARLAPDALGDDPDRFLRLDEAQWHDRQSRTGSRRKAWLSARIRARTAPRGRDSPHIARNAARPMARSGPRRRPVPPSAARAPVAPCPATRSAPRLVRRDAPGSSG